MRRHDHVWVSEQRVLGGRLSREHVERRARYLAGVQCGLQVVLDDQRTAGHVQHAHPVLALGERLGVEPALGFGRLGQVQGKEVRRGVNLIGGGRLLYA